MGDATANGSAFPDGGPLQDSGDIASGLDNPAFDGILKEEAPHKTIVSFVLDPADSPDDDSSEDGPSVSEVMRLFSSIYAIMLILLGLGFPLAEATGEDWLGEWYIGLFYAYLYLGAITFLIYCQVLLSMPQHVEKPQVETPYGKGYIIRSPTEQNELDNLKAGINNNWSMTSPGEIEQSQTHTNTDNVNPEKINNIHMVDLTGPEYKGSFGRGMGLKLVPSVNRMRKESGHLRRHSLQHEGKISRSGSLKSNTDAKGNEIHVIDLCGHQGSVNVQLNEGRDRNDLDVELIDMEGFKGMFSHEGSSFYLRIGALLFGIGNVIYVALELEHHYTGDCETPSMAWIFFFQLAFILGQTFFIFKNPKIHLTRSIAIARLGFMHLVATNICVWIRTLISEISEEFRHGPGSHDNSSDHYADMEDGCAESGIVSAAGPYLFPFVLEYSLIAMATAAVMYDYLSTEDDKVVIQNIHHAIKNSTMKKQAATTATSTSFVEHFEESLLDKSHRGVFLGMMIFTGLAISTVFFFFSDDTTDANIIFYTGDITVSVFLISAALAAFYKCRKLSYRTGKSLSIDDLLILISMSGSFMFELCILVSAADTLVGGEYAHNSRLIMAVISSSLAAVETVIQVVFILAGMRMYSSQEKHQKEKPGRGAVAFMLLANVSVWLFRSIEIKQLTHGVQEEFFGFEAWIVILNIFLPLLLFYRFHSSVCLADIWQVAYKPMHH